MASRKYHLFIGLIIYIISLFFYQVRKPFLPEAIDIDTIWFVAGLIMALTGAEMADYDQLLGRLKHRDIFTHSALIPIILVISFVLTSLLGSSGGGTLLFTTVVSPFVFGYASHLILDLFPPYNYKKIKEEEGFVKATLVFSQGIKQGITGEEILSQMKGTYLIHLPLELPIGEKKKDGTRKQRKTLPKNATRIWLVLNALLAFFMGVPFFLGLLLLI